MTITNESGVFTATGQSAVVELYRGFNIRVSGFGVASIQLQKSFDGGTNWDNTGNPFVSDEVAQGDEPERGILYRLDCTSFTSGTGGPSNNGIEYRLSQ